jgi:hypothetical protein
VPDFDAELYLRLIGEQMLLDRSEQDRGPRRPPIAEAAAALVAVGIIAAPHADAVLDDYSLAAALRNDPQFRRRTMTAGRSDRSEGKPLKPRRVVPCERTIDQPQATVQVRYVVLSEDTTSVAVTWSPDPGHPWGGRPPQATLADDRGTVETAHFSGGGSNEGMLGRLTTIRPLAPDTRWIELDGTRIELTERAWQFDASLERLPAQEPAHRYLWQRIAMPTEFHPEPADSIEHAIDALVAAGALAVDDPLLEHVRAVLEAMQQRGPGPTPRPPAGVARMPEPWRSLLTRHGRHDGPTGSIVLGAVTPAFDGFSVALLELKSNPGGFQVEVDVAPGLDHVMPFDWSVQPRQLAWWARDDRGNHFLGHRGNWSSNEDFGHGLIGFRPALDPRATCLEIMPTAETTRAVISFSLPWARHHAEVTVKYR